jgi:ABC-2 type transport system permease protein
MRYVFDGQPRTFQAIGAPMCGLFPFIIMFLITSIAMLRERTIGTLERLMSLPIAKVDLLAGYGIAFGLLAALQAVVVCLVGFLALGLDAPHGAWLVGLLAVGNAVLGMALGLFVSAFARTEFQAVQFMPAIIFPQLLLCGLFVDHRPAEALSRSSVSRYGARYFAAIFVGGDQVGVSVISELNPYPPTMWAVR